MDKMKEWLTDLGLSIKNIFKKKDNAPDGATSTRAGDEQDSFYDWVSDSNKKKRECFFKIFRRSRNVLFRSIP